MGSNLSKSDSPIVKSIYSIPPSNGADFSSDEAALIASVKIQDKLGRLPLHLACGNGNTSLEDINRILKAYPGAIYVGDIDGNIPLNYACIAGHSLEVIQALLLYYPEAVYVKSIDGKLALHFAYRYSSCEVIDKIAASYPGAAQIIDKYGYKPSDYHAFNTSNDHLLPLSSR
jgi:ankyrin repeat protein